MKIEGIETTHRKVQIEITDEILFKSFISRLKEKNKELVPFDYIRDGMWLEYEYTHPHNGDDTYKDVRDATEEEIHFSNFLDEIRSRFYGYRE